MKTTSGASAKKANPWDAIVQNPLAPVRAKKTNPATMIKEIKGWKLHHSPFWR